MREIGFLKKISKGFVSLLLVLLVMTNLGVPLSVFAEGEAATGNDICAILYDIRSGNNSNH